MKYFYPFSTCFIIFLACFTNGVHAQKSCGVKKCKKHCWGAWKPTENKPLCNDTAREWKLVFSDEFDTDSLDYVKWKDSYPFGRHLTSYCYAKEGKQNLEINKGIIQLQTVIDTGTYQRMEFDSTGKVYFVPAFYKYTSGMLFSNQQFMYGRFEMRGKIPEINGGQWPAFWLFGECSQEIDVFEFFGSDKKKKLRKAGNILVMTYHRKKNPRDECKCMFTDKYISKVPLSNKFHTYAVEWDEYKLVWKIDGIILFSLYKYKVKNKKGKVFFVENCTDLAKGVSLSENLYFPYLPMNIILDNAINKDYGKFPSVFEVDYVRVWQR